jgi:MerR family transcriptional regulator, thiopeptide resistance regulator
MRTVSEVSELARVTVRSLHHYDEIGLLKPSARSDAGYRLYSREDLARLQEIVIWRQLGFSLADVKALLDDPQHDRVRALREQRRLVERQIERLGAIAAALDASLAALVQGTDVEEAAMFERFDPTAYDDETRELWGDSEAYRESTARVASYGESEWCEIRAEAEQIVSDFVALQEDGEDPAGDLARAVAERHRQHVSRWFYECSPRVHRGLGEMYVADERFARNYERHAAGLAAYVRDAFAANSGTV